jgi:acyl-CoA thioesterase-1
MSAALLLKITIAGLIILVLIAVISLAEFASQFVRYKNYWNKNNEQTAQAGELTYVALGDSAAQGVGATSPAKGYVGLIAKELESQKGQPLHTLNFSKSGARIKDVLDTQLPKYQALNLDQKHILTIEIGANDIVRSEIPQFEKEMDELMSKLPKYAVMSDMPSFQGSRYAKYESKVNQANEIMNRLAKKHHLKLAKLNEHTHQNHSLKVFAADFFHPSNHGYEVNWLPAFMDRLKESGQV